MRRVGQRGEQQNTSDRHALWITLTKKVPLGIGSWRLEPPAPYGPPPRFAISL